MTAGKSIIQLQNSFRFREQFSKETVLELHVGRNIWIQK
jgi:hypothetical protein